MKKFIIFLVIVLFLPVSILSQTMRDSTKVLKTTFSDYQTEVLESTSSNKTEIDDNKDLIEGVRSSSLVLYYTDEISPSGEYLLMIDTPPAVAESTITSTLDSATVIVTSFTVETPLELLSFRSGLYHSHFLAKVDSATKETRLRTEVWKGTGTALTFLFSTVQSNLLTTDKTYYDVHTATNEILGTIGFLVIRIVADVTGSGPTPVLTFYMEGADSSHFEMPSLISDVSVTKIIPGVGFTVTPENGRSDVTIDGDFLRKSTGVVIEQNTSDIAAIAESTGTVNRPYTMVVGFTKDCDYICDGSSDYVEAQDAVNEAGSGTILFRKGVYDMDKGSGYNIETTSINTVFMGEGDATIFQGFGNGSVIGLLHSGSKLVNLQIQSGDAAIDHLVEITASSCTVANCYIRTFHNNGSSAIQVTVSGDNVQIVNNRVTYVDETSNYGLDLFGSNMLITENVIFAKNKGIQVDGGDDSIISNNRIVVTGGAGGTPLGIELVGAAIRWMIIGNDFTGCDLEITNNGTGTLIRNNKDKDGGWYPETAQIDMSLEDIHDADHGSFKTMIASDSISAGAYYGDSERVKFIDKNGNEIFNMTESSMTYREGYWVWFSSAYIYELWTSSIRSLSPINILSDEVNIAGGALNVLNGDGAKVANYIRVNESDKLAFAVSSGPFTSPPSNDPTHPAYSVAITSAGEAFFQKVYSAGEELTAGNGNGAVEYTTRTVQLAGFMGDVYKSTSIPINFISMPSDGTIFELEAFSLFGSTCASVILEVMTSTGTNTTNPIAWTSVSTIEITTGTCKSGWVPVSVDINENEFLGLFVNFISEIGGGLNVGVGVTAKYEKK